MLNIKPKTIITHNVESDLLPVVANIRYEHHYKNLTFKPRATFYETISPLEHI